MGRGGEIVKQLRTETKAKIRIGETVNGSDERVVQIHSTSDETNECDDGDGVRICPAMDAVFKATGEDIVMLTLQKENYSNLFDQKIRAVTWKVNTYPTVRGFTAIGTGGDDFVQAMVVAVESVLQHQIPQGQVKQKMSSGGKYVSVNIGPVQVVSSEQVQAVYNAMKSDERMKYFLQMTGLILSKLYRSDVSCQKHFILARVALRPYIIADTSYRRAVRFHELVGVLKLSEKRRSITYTDETREKKDSPDNSSDADYDEESSIGSRSSIILHVVNMYPTVRGFTAIGTGGDDFVQAMVVAVESVLQHQIPQGQVKQKMSSGGKYVSVNIGPVQVVSSEQVNTYPTVRGFTAIGTGGDDFVQAMVVAVESVLQHQIPQGQVKQKMSSGGKYVSVNIGPVQVVSSEQVQAVYNAMKSDERMKYFL
nr:hypothetical protein [Tanacetum cinerariifolium]